MQTKNILYQNEKSLIKKLSSKLSSGENKDVKYIL